MQVFIKGESKYIPVSTITLQAGKNGVTYPFHCVTCGNTQSVIGGKVSKITPILEPSSQIPVITPCKSCKAKYIFQDDVNGDVIDFIKIILNPLAEKKPFYCYLGGGENKSLNKILEYEKGKIYSFIELKYMTPPFYSRCGNITCTANYYFTKLS